MVHWWGSSSDSQKQTSERNQRAARRTIAKLPVVQDSNSDDEYRDCDLSNSFLNLDGLDDNDDSAESTNSSTTSANMAAVIFQDEAGTDDDDYYKKLSSLKNRSFNAKEAEFWFTGIETSMKHMGIKSQWAKREVLHSLLPDEVQIKVKSLLKKDQTSAGTHPYRTLKLELLKIYSPKPEAAFELQGYSESMQ